MKPINLVTGATSGIGWLTAERLERKCRDRSTIRSGPSRPTQSVATAEDYLGADLSSVAEARGLGQAIAARGAPIALLMLAAGCQATDDSERTADGIERTFAVNTVANVALLDELIAAGSVPQRVILFSSGTHDPKKRAGLPTPRHADPKLLAFPDRDPLAVGDKPSVRGGRAYSSSKLAIAMIAYAYAREQPSMRIDAFDPQLTPGTGLARGQSAAIQFLWHRLLPLIVPLVPFMNRPEAVADAAVDLALDKVLPPGSGRYIEVRRGRCVEGRSSEMSYDVEAQDRLLAGIRQLIAN